ncbi:hypothetical protein D3C75_1112340 [compost metagenome]
MLMTAECFVLYGDEGSAVFLLSNEPRLDTLVICGEDMKGFIMKKKNAEIDEIKLVLQDVLHFINTDYISV